MDTTPQGMDANMQTPQKNGVGQMIGIIIIILIIILGGIYFWMMKSDEKSENEEKQMTQEQVSSKSELENELNAEGDANIDAELSGIDKELSQ